MAAWRMWQRGNTAAARDAIQRGGGVWLTGTGLFLWRVPRSTAALGGVSAYWLASWLLNVASAYQWRGVIMTYIVLLTLQFVQLTRLLFVIHYCRIVTLTVLWLLCDGMLYKIPSVAYVLAHVCYQRQLNAYIMLFNLIYHCRGVAAAAAMARMRIAVIIVTCGVCNVAA